MLQRENRKYREKSGGSREKPGREVRNYAVKDESELDDTVLNFFSSNNKDI